MDERKKIKVIFVPKNINDYTFTKNFDGKILVSYNVPERGSIFKNIDSTLSMFNSFPEIWTIIPSISIFVTGDLVFYTTTMGRDGHSGWWCAWCNLKRTQWARNPSLPGRHLTLDNL